ncbi:MAG: T9SS C-terminal target domain-containing protein [Acidobacteria bacterium]|nr:T9SS C-terminal target domain-containing protein [Acidobacteriota bacterium]
MKIQKLNALLVPLLFAALAIQGFGQTVNKSPVETANSVGNGYALTVESIAVAGFNGLQSFAVAQYAGKWLLIGGRTDGLHRRRPFESFPVSGNNTSILVIDPETKRSWSSAVNDLPAALKEQLQSTNMQFIQRGKTLYLIGGYGYSNTAGDHITHNKLTAVRVDCLISAVQKGNADPSCFRQISDPVFALTGGQIGRIGETYYLVGGQKFVGRYNPMGPDHGPGFSQQYSNQIRTFRINDDGIELKIENFVAITDEANLHRRDFNMLPQIFPNNVQGFTVFSGVFQVGADIPFINTVDVFADKHIVNNAFAQYLSHYHSAKVAFYDAANHRMENIFFGGISQYEENAGALTRNDDVPFTKVISKVVREKDGKMTESKISEMPGFLGAGAEFVLNPQLPMYENEIVKTNEINADRILLGHIVGGINSSKKSIFFSNSGLESVASKTVFEVWLTRPPKQPAKNSRSESNE